jgi:DNA-binding transcriptional ArsR family regulator
MSRSHSAAAIRLTEAAPVFAALGDVTRIRLVARLSADGPLSISHLSEGTGVTRQAITKHLRAMGDAGLVRDTRRGRERIWELEPKRLEKARRSLDQISADWDSAINRLKAFVETDRDERS